MKIEYNHAIGLPRNLVWKWLKDETVLKNSIPNCKLFVETSSGIYRGEIDIRIGPINDVYAIDIRRIEEKNPSFYRLKINGTSKLGKIQAQSDLFLRDWQGACKLTIKADVVITGTMEVTPDRLLNGAAIKVIENLFQNLEKEIKKAVYQSRKKFHT
ncbi:CoxG family protein [Neobacillus rhizophilus]|uniref:Carbon monoxide dehydrogenase n=1 Tax=Neobacillus rhizophilus TaxID=2833579 RepID=A0A942U123_9BACI|nr:SRPBCC domain-containing protein [Neobacillus rhizophilus]MBS4210938.1 carbon monoxide dehydrogenase [Neobacillus rhizophilus]